MTDDELWLKWWQTVPFEYTDAVHEDVCRSAFLAALKIERERCAKVAESFYFKSDKIRCADTMDDIAAAIRGGNNTVECRWEDNLK